MEEPRGTAPRSGVLGDMSHLDDLPVEERYIPHSGPMFSRGTVARAELATDLAITIVADGGWPALTMRNVARAANLTPQAIAAWFPSVAVMRTAVAQRYGDRWIRQRGYLARSHLLHARLAGQIVEDEIQTVSDLTVALLPKSWLEETYDGIWLTIVEAGRWDESIGETVTDIQERERDLVCDLLDPTGRQDIEHLERDVDLVLALVRGLRATHVVAREGVTADRAAVALAGIGSAG